MKFKHLFFMLTMLMSMAVCNMALVSCSDDDPENGGKSEQPTEDPEKNTTDVAVTGPVLDYGALYADIKGVVNLNSISVSYSDVRFGIVISERPDLEDGVDFFAQDIVGRTIKAHFLLRPSTTYYYATFVSPTESFAYWGETYSFTTKPINKDIAVTGGTSDIGAFSVKINGFTNPEEVYAADAAATVGIEIAEDADFSKSHRKLVLESNEIDDIKKFSVEATSLAANKKYYYRTYLHADYFNGFFGQDFYFYGDTQTFTTKSVNEDAVVTGDASDIGMFSARISGSTNLKQFEAGGIKTSVGIEVSEKDDFSNARKISVTGNVEKFNVEVTSLSIETKYYYRTYLKTDIKSQEYYYYGEKKSFTTKGLDNSHHYVDLGLPSGTLWATMNVGASKPEEYGDYFAWGETEGYNRGKTNFDWSTYKWCKGSETTMTKYCHDSNYGYNGFMDNKTELDPEDDAAYVNWGSDWRMPTYDQLKELREQCTWTWYTINNVIGYLVAGKNGNVIFLPAAGYRDDSSLNYAGSYGVCWSRTLYSDYPRSAWYLGFLSSNVDMRSYYRYHGRSVRPVRSPE
ncbi:MAG: hypothetical protein ILA39_05740 [Bacteroidaceae bacterium]|nr:hypothetical protein [Bacteroidaceae bacterium]